MSEWTKVNNGTLADVIKRIGSLYTKSMELQMYRRALSGLHQLKSIKHSAEARRERVRAELEKRK